MEVQHSICCVVSTAGVCDYRVLGNRSRSYLALNDLSSAGKDAELACRLRPFWAKVRLFLGCLRLALTPSAHYNARYN